MTPVRSRWTRRPSASASPEATLPESVTTLRTPASANRDQVNSPAATTESRAAVSRGTLARHRLTAFGRPPRILGVDLARGLAIVGMMGAHVGVAPSLAWTRPDTWGDLVNGRSSILFAVVAGLSIALLTRRTAFDDPDQVRTLRLQMLGRGAVVFAIGTVLELLNTGAAIILSVYAALFIVIIPFLGLRRRALALWAAGLTLISPGLLGLVGALSLDADGPGMALVLFGNYPLPEWLALMLIGLIVGRSRPERTATAIALLAGGAALAITGYAAGAAAEVWLDTIDWFAVSQQSVFSVLAGADPDGYWAMVTAMQPEETAAWAALGVEPHSGGTPEIVGSGGFALAVIGLCLLLARPLRMLILPLAALGSMPLTAYSAHIVLILATIGTAQDDQPDNGLWFGMTVGLLVGATAWTILLGRGPLERITAWCARRAAHPSSDSRAAVIPARYDRSGPVAAGSEACDPGDIHEPPRPSDRTAP